jgi:hypothetical protein
MGTMTRNAKDVSINIVIVLYLIIFELVGPLFMLELSKSVTVFDFLTRWHDQRLELARDRVD